MDPQPTIELFSQETLEVHWGKHHRTYVTNLNNQLKDKPLANKALEEVCAYTSCHTFSCTLPYPCSYWDNCVLHALVSQMLFLVVTGPQTKQIYSCKSVTVIELVAIPWQYTFAETARPGKVAMCHRADSNAFGVRRSSWRPTTTAALPQSLTTLGRSSTTTSTGSPSALRSVSAISPCLTCRH